MAKLLRNNRPNSPIEGINRSNFSDSKKLQNYVKSQIYVKGFTIALGAGANPNAGNIQLGGQARFLYGIALYGGNVGSAAYPQADTFSMTINNEVIFDTVSCYSISPLTNPRGIQDMYFPIPRPLSGSDTVQLSVTAVGALAATYWVFYLSNYAPQM